MRRLSKIIEEAENRIERRWALWLARYKKKLPRYLFFGAVGWYFYGMFLNSLELGIRATFHTAQEEVKSIWVWNPLQNFPEVLTPFGLTVTVVLILLICLITKKGYIWFSGYKYIKDERGFHSLPDGTHGTSGFLTEKEIETICVNYLRSLEEVKVTGTGHNYFVPRQSMGKEDVLEDFIEAVNGLNQNPDASLSANSFFIIDDTKQRDKMTEEFYSAVRREIQWYQERADYLIQSGSTSPSVMERWINKIATLEEKKRHYEEILRRELDGLDDEFETLKFLSRELSIRVRGLRAKRVA